MSLTGTTSSGQTSETNSNKTSSNLPSPKLPAWTSSGPLAIVGAQWGDEGKGKITDFLSQHCDYVVRYQGGNNAGHTIVVGDKTTILHVVPSGVLSPTCTSIIGHGVVLDPEVFLQELAGLESAGISISPDRIKISTMTNIITSYHRLLDGQREGLSTQKIGTTGRGIGPCYEDKFSRRGLKAKDLLDSKTLKEKLSRLLQEKEILFKELYQCEFPSLEEEVARLTELGTRIAPYVDNTFGLLQTAHEKDQKILFEGAQGILLDIDYGTYPFVTSSHTSFGGMHTGAGVPSNHSGQIIGIAKAYVTRVGEGPFPTELNDPIGETIQKKGNEFGATTGRRRRCGWLDLPLLKYACDVGHFTHIALTKADVLEGIGGLKVCTQYKYLGEITDRLYPGMDLAEVEPVYEDMPAIENLFTGEEMSSELSLYIRKIEDFLGIPVSMIAYGPERSQLWLKQ